MAHDRYPDATDPQLPTLYKERASCALRRCSIQTLSVWHVGPVRALLDPMEEKS